MSNYEAYFNGEWVPVEEVVIGSIDRGFVVGDVVFDVERTFHGRLFRLDEHIERLYQSLNYIRIDPGLTIDEMREICEEAVQRNVSNLETAGDFIVSQFVTRGTGYKPWDTGPPTVCVKVGPVPLHRYAPIYGDGLHASIVRTQSLSPQTTDPRLKHNNRMNFTLAMLEANDVALGAVPILTDEYGNITEEAESNVFIVTNGIIRTPAGRAIQRGISRRTILDLAAELGIPAFEEDISPFDFYSADEAFLTSTYYCMLPITTADHRPVGAGKPGPVTKKLLGAWGDMVGVDIAEQATKYGG